MHPVGQQRIVDLAHPHPGALLDPLDRRLGGQPAVDRLDDPAAPAFVIGEHLVGLEHFLVLSPHAEFGLAGHPVDLFAHLVEGEIHALQFGIAVFGHDMFDGDPRLVIDRVAGGQALDQRQPGHPHRPGLLRAQRDFLVIDQPGVGDQLGQHHRDGLQRLDLDFLVAARIGVLDAQYPDRTLAPDDRHPGKGMELLFPGFRPVGEVRVSGRLGQVERFDVLGDRPDQPFAHPHPGDVDRFLRQPLGGKQLEHAFAQQVNRADFAIEAFADHLDHGVELGLGVAARCHHVVQAREDGAGGGDGAGNGHGP